MISTEKVNRVLEKKSTKRKFFFLLKILFVILVIYLLILSLTNTTLLSVSDVTIEIKDQRKLEKDEMFKILKNELDETFLYIPKSTYYLFNENSLREKVLKENILIKSIDISWEFFNKWNIEIRERSPVAIYCSESCNLVDDTALIFDPIVDVNKVGLKENGTDNTLGERYIGEKTFSYVSRIIQFLNEKRLVIDSIYIDKESLDVVFFLEDGVKLIIDTDDDIYVLTRSIHLTIFDTFGRNLDSIEYIDFRNPFHIYHLSK